MKISTGDENHHDSRLLPRYLNRSAAVGLCSARAWRTRGAVLIAGTFAADWLWYAVTGHSVAYTSPASFPHPFWIIVVAQFIGAAGEEVGWRCFLQPTLQSRIGTFPASIVVGIAWGVWHIGVFAEGWVYASLFILFAVSLSVIFGELLSDARGGRLLLATSCHALFNLGMLLWFNEEDGSRLAMGTLASACTIAAVIVMVIVRGKWAGTSAVHLPTKSAR